MIILKVKAWGLTDCSCWVMDHLSSIRKVLHSSSSILKFCARESLQVKMTLITLMLIVNVFVYLWSSTLINLGAASLVSKKNIEPFSTAAVCNSVCCGRKGTGVTNNINEGCVLFKIPNKPVPDRYSWCWTVIQHQLHHNTETELAKRNPAIKNFFTCTFPTVVSEYFWQVLQMNYQSVPKCITWQLLTSCLCLSPCRAAVYQWHSGPHWAWGPPD